MKKFCFFTAVLVAFFMSCASSPERESYLIPEYKNYSETIDLPGMDAETIYRRTDLWVEKQNKEANTSFMSGNTINVSRSERKITAKKNISGFVRSKIAWQRAIFDIENERCQLTFYRDRDKFFGDNIDEAREYAVGYMDDQKKIAAEYKAYITKSSLSQAEIDAIKAEGSAIIAKGDEAFDEGKFSLAEGYYRQVLDEQIFADIQPDADIYIALGMAIDSQVSDVSKTEQFILDTNFIIRSFNEWAERFRSDQFYQGWALYGHYIESERLKEAYKFDNRDIMKLDSALEMYNKALSLDPRNETALLGAEYVKQRKANITSRYSQINTALDNIEKSLESEEKRLQAQRAAANWDRVAQNLNKLATDIAQIQQNQSGGNAGGYSGGGSSSGQSQAGASGGASSAMRDNYLTMYNRHARQVESIFNSLRPTKGTDSTKSSYNRMVRTLRAHQRDMRNIRRDAQRDGVHIDQSPLENQDPL